MWTVTVEVQGEPMGSAGARHALEDLLNRLGLRHVTVAQADDRVVARLLVGGSDPEEAEENAITLWRYAVEQISLLDWPPVGSRTIALTDTIAVR